VAAADLDALDAALGELRAAGWRRCSPAGGRSAAGGWPSRTWSSGAFCARRGLPASSTLQLEPAWDAWQAGRYRRGETGQRRGYTGNPFRPR